MFLLAGLLEVGLISSWQAHLEKTGSSAAPPTNLFYSEELVLNRAGELQKELRFPGNNKV